MLHCPTGIDIDLLDHKAVAMDRKVAVVTGGTRGIGYGISSVLARQQYSLVLGIAAVPVPAFLLLQSLTRHSVTLDLLSQATTQITMLRSKPRKSWRPSTA